MSFIPSLEGIGFPDTFYNVNKLFMQWANFLAKEAATTGLSLEQTAAFVNYFQTQNLSKTEAQLVSEFNVDIPAFRKWIGELYEKFAQNYPELVISNTQNKLEKLQAYLREKYNSELDVLKPLAAMKLFKSLVVRERLQQEPWVTRRICQFLGYSSLAIELVGRYLNNIPDLSLEILLQRLEKKREEYQPIANTNSLMPYEYGVTEAFELSWEKLDKNAQSFACLLSLCALTDIPLSVETIEDKQKQQENQQAIADLLELHLLQQKTPGIYLLNPLIRQFLRIKLENFTEADEAKTKFAVMMLELAKLIPQQPNPEDIVNFTPHIPHIKEVASNLSQYLSTENLITLFTKLAWFYQGQKLYQQAESWLQRCVELTENHLDLEHSYIVASLNNLAALYESTGCYNQAEPLYRQALELRKRLLGDNHLDVATSLNNLALLYESTGRYNEARPLFEEALKVRKRLLGEEHPDVATNLSYLAVVYESIGRYKKAESLYQQALELWKRLVGEEHSHVATSLNNLGALYCFTGRYSQAEPLLKQALKLRKRLLGEEHPDVATSLNNLGQLYESTGRYREAEPFYKQALELTKRLLGDNHPDVAISLNNLAALYRHTRRYRKAKPLFEQALKICEQTLGVSHPTTMTVRANYASFLKETYH